MAAEGLPAAKRAAEVSEQYRDAAINIRARSDILVKALGAIGTAAVTAIGYARLADVFPYEGRWWLFVPLALGVLAMVTAVVLLARRFQGVHEPIVLTSDVKQTCNFNHFARDEEGTVASVYRQTAGLNGVDSLRAYLARAHRFERTADRTEDADVAASLRQRADQISAEVGATKERANLIILRERAKTALFAPATAGLLFLFIAGWYGTALAADAMQSGRSDEIEVDKKCLELREKAGDAPLPRICGNPPMKSKEKPSAAKAAAEGVPAIAKLWSDCRQKAEEAGEDEKVCAPLLHALEASREAAPAGAPPLR